MRSLLFSVLIPSFLIILGIILLLVGLQYGLFISAIGAIWLVVSFIIDYKEDEKQPLGMGRGRPR